MDSNTPDENAIIKAKLARSNVNFPLSFMDFLSATKTSKTVAGNNFEGPLKPLITQTLTTSCLEIENQESQPTSTSSCITKETLVLEKVTNDEGDYDFLPSYRNLFERIKRSSIGDNLFKSSPGIAACDTKQKHTFSKESSQPHEQIKISYTSDFENKLCTKIKKIVTKENTSSSFESLNTSEASQSVTETGSKIVGGDLSVNRSVEDFGNKEELKHTVVSPVTNQRTLKVTDISQGDQCHEGMKNEQESVESLPEMNIADIERICYKAMVFQQTGQVPVECNDCDEPEPKQIKSSPCLCRFYCKNRCKKVQPKPALKGPCRVGKGYASDRRKLNGPSCVCKILPNSKVANKRFQIEMGKASIAKPEGAKDGIAMENTNRPNLGKRKFTNKRRVDQIDKPNTDEESAKKYLDVLAAKTKLLAKLEMSEKRLKHLAEYDSSSYMVSGRPIVSVNEDEVHDISVLSLSEDDSQEQHKENISISSTSNSLGSPIDLTADSPKSPNVFSGSHQFKQNTSEYKMELRLDSDDKMPLLVRQRQKSTVGLYGVTKGVTYISDSSDDGNSDNPVRQRQKSTVGLYGVTKGVTYISDSSDDGNSDNPCIALFDKNLATSSYSATESPIHNIILQNSKHGHYDTHLHTKGSDKSISKFEQLDNTNIDQQSYNLVASGSKDNLPVLEKESSKSHFAFNLLSNIEPVVSVNDVGYGDLSNSNNAPKSAINNYASTSWSVLDCEMPTSDLDLLNVDVLPSYATYDSDNDDRMSMIIRSPESLVNVDSHSPIEITELEHKAPLLVKDGVFIPQATTSAAPETAFSGRILRVRTTPRITETMKRRTVKKEGNSLILPLKPVNNASAISPTCMGRSRNKPLQQSTITTNNGMKNVKISISPEAANLGERAKLKQEIKVMALQLRKVRVLAARATKLAEVAKAAKVNELQALKLAQVADKKLKQRLAHEKLLELKAKKRDEEKAKVKEANKKKKAEQKEKAARERSKEQSWECPICFEPRSASTQLSVTPCGHLFCKTCILQVGHSTGQCPLCNKEFTEAQVTPLFFNFSI